MGVDAPIGVTHAYYFAYEIGLVLAFFSYWAACGWSPPKLMVSLGEWREPRDYVRPEERGVIVGLSDVESFEGGGEKGSGGVKSEEKGVGSID